MSRPFCQTLTVVGVGLIGGSIGLAARRRGLAEHVLGVGWRQTSLDRALALGVIAEGTLDLSAAAARSDLMVFCTPVDQIVDQVLASARVCRPGTLLTDAGSTKAAIVRGLEGKLPAEIIFVGSHPLAGSEKHGPDHADAELFQGRVTVVTPTAQTPAAASERISAFWQALGARVHQLDPEEHDRALALTSHLPHLAAAALAGILPVELHDLAATGFRDTTRVAAGDPSIWTGIFEQNRAAVLETLTRFKLQLDQFQHALLHDDRVLLSQLLALGKQSRDALDRQE